MVSAETVRQVGRPRVERIPLEEIAQHVGLLEQELNEGRSIELTRGDAVVAEIRAKTMPVEEEKLWAAPDFMAQMREVFGDRVFPEGTGLQWVNEDRGLR